MTYLSPLHSCHNLTFLQLTAIIFHCPRFKRIQSMCINENWCSRNDYLLCNQMQWWSAITCLAKIQPKFVSESFIHKNISKMVDITFKSFIISRQIVFSTLPWKGFQHPDNRTKVFDPNYQRYLPHQLLVLGDQVTDQNCAHLCVESGFDLLLNWSTFWILKIISYTR